MLYRGARLTNVFLDLKKKTLVSRRIASSFSA